MIAKKNKSLRKFYENEMVKDRIIPDSVLYDAATNQTAFIENTLFPGMDLIKSEPELFDAEEIGKVIPDEWSRYEINDLVEYWTDGDAIIQKNASGDYYFYQADDCEGWLDMDGTIQEFMGSLADCWHWGGATGNWDYKAEEIEETEEEYRAREWEPDDWIDAGYVQDSATGEWVLKESRKHSKKK